MPLPPAVLLHMTTPFNRFNCIQEHVDSGGRHFHLFISSSDKIMPGYISRAIHTTKPGDTPVIIKIEISPENPAILAEQEDDNVLSAFIPKKFIKSINKITEEGKEGEKLNLETLQPCASWPVEGGEREAAREAAEQEAEVDAGEEQRTRLARSKLKGGRDKTRRRRKDKRQKRKRKQSRKKRRKSKRK